MLFICLSAVFAACKYSGRFTCSCGYTRRAESCDDFCHGWWDALGASSEEMIYWLCGGVLVGGVLQLFIPAIDFMRQKLAAKMSRAARAPMRVRALLATALAGAAILQVNIDFEAIGTRPQQSTVSVLYLASRLMGITTRTLRYFRHNSLFPLMADSLARKDEAAFAESFLRVCEWSWAYPYRQASVCFYWVNRWSNYYASVDSRCRCKNRRGVGRDLWMRVAFYSAATFATRGLHASQAIPCTVRVSAICLLVNLVGSSSHAVLGGTRPGYGKCYRCNGTSHTALARAHACTGTIQYVCKTRYRHKDTGLNRNHGCLLSRRFTTPEYKQPCRKPAIIAVATLIPEASPFLHPLHPRF